MKGNNYDQVVLRSGLGIMFLITGLSKLAGPAGVAGFLGSLNFPAPAFFAWVLLLVEILGGAALLFGYMLKYAVWPLIIVMAVVITIVLVPAYLADRPGSDVNILLHLVATTGLISLFLRESELSGKK